MILQTQEQIDTIAVMIERSDLVAYDIETDGLNVRSNKIIGIGVALNIDEAYYIPLWTWNGKELEMTGLNPNPILNALKKTKILAHNAYFDIESTRTSFQVDLIDRVHADTILLKHTVDEERPFGLKDIAKKLYGLDATKEQEEMKSSIKANGGTASEFFKCDMDIMGKYCMQDCKLTYKIYEHYSPILEEEGLESFFYDDEVMPLLREVTTPMQRNGIPLDMPLLSKTDEELRCDIANLELEIHNKVKPYTTKFDAWFRNKDYPVKATGNFAQAVAETFNLILPKLKSGKFSLSKSNVEALPSSPFKRFLQKRGTLTPEQISSVQDIMHTKEKGNTPMLNLSSKHHLKKIFFEELEETALSHTDKGNPQINDEFLDLMAKKYEWVSLLRVYNRLQKLSGSYINRFVEQNEDGIFYPKFNGHRTISGRYGSDLQQLPRPYEEKHRDSVHPLVFKYVNVIRRLFISGPNYKFVDSDYESLEPHVFAHVSNDNGLRDIFRKGHDFYSTIAIKTEGLHYLSADKEADNYLGEVDKDKRQKAKAYALGIPYGMEDYALSKSLDIPQSEASKLIRAYLDQFPDLERWMKDSEEKVKSSGWVQSEAGRIRHMHAAVGLAKYGDSLLNSLKLWERYHENAPKYEQMKFLRKQMKNYLNNAKNFQIQSLAASITNRACIAINRDLRERGMWGYICAQIHDQIVVRCKEEDANIVRDLVQWHMENTYKISIPLKAPAEIADNLYDGH